MKLAFRTLLVAALIVEFFVISRRIPLPVIDFLAAATTPVVNGPFTDYRGEIPGKVHKITPGDLPKPYASRAAANPPHLASRPANAWPQAPAGFKVDLFANGLQNPRLIRTAPNGDLFLAESYPGRILVFHGTKSDGKPEEVETFAEGLHRPFGIAFYPPGPNPGYVYIGNTDSVVRFPYQNGDLKARGSVETVIPSLPSGDETVGGGGHWTRDVAFSLDAKQMFVSVGSRTNIADTDEDNSEFHRADILVANPDGSDLHVYASGIRNPVGIAVDPQGQLWASVNERDDIGDNLPPDYITHVQENGFYGWPWYTSAAMKTRG